MKTVFAILLVFLAHAAQAQSILSLNPSFAATACPYPATAATDGCAGALVALGSLSGASAYDTNGFNDFRQSGQSYAGCSAASLNLSCHPPSNNVAGVDYAVGLPTAHVALLVDPNVSPPANCTWASVGSLSTGPQLTCGNTAGQDVDIENIELGAIGGHGCTIVVLKHANLTAGRTVTIKYNHMLADANCTHGLTGAAADIMADSGSLGANVDIEWNDFLGNWLDACCLTGTQGGVFIPTSGNVTFKYNNVQGWNAVMFNIGASSTTNLYMDYNFMRGAVSRGGSGIHTEFTALRFNAGQTVLPYVEMEYNTAVETADTCNCGTAILWFNNGSPGYTYTASYAIGNTVISNIVGTATTNTGETVTGWIDDGTGTYAAPGGAGNLFTVHSVTGSGSFGSKSTVGNIFMDGPPNGSGQYTFDCRTGGICSSNAFNPVLTAQQVNSVAAVATAIGGGLIYFGTNTFTNIVVQNNWTDPTSSGGAFTTQGATCSNSPTFDTSNKSLVTGAANNSWSVTGSGC